MKTLSRHLRAFTLVEVLITCAVISLVMAAMAGAVMGLQRSFSASRHFSAAHAEMVRVADWFKRDARAATSAAVVSGGQAITMQVPSETPSLLSLQLPSMLASLLGASGSSAPATTAITYRFLNGTISRTEGSKTISIATRLSRFSVEQSGTRLNLQLAFQSGYSAQKSETAATRLVTSVSTRSSGL